MSRELKNRSAWPRHQARALAPVLPLTAMGREGRTEAGAQAGGQCRTRADEGEPVGGDSMRHDLGVKGLKEPSIVPRVMAGALVGGGVFCSLKGHPGRVGRGRWLEEELSLGMMDAGGAAGTTGSSQAGNSTVIPATPVTLSAGPSWAALQLAELQARTKHSRPSCSLGGLLTSTAQRLLAPTWDQMPLPLHRARPWSLESHFQESLLSQLPACPGHLGTASCPTGVRLADLLDSRSERAGRSSECRQLIAATQGGG